MRILKGSIQRPIGVKDYAKPYIVIGQIFAIGSHPIVLIFYRQTRMAQSIHYPFRGSFSVGPAGSAPPIPALGQGVKIAAHIIHITGISYADSAAYPIPDNRIDGRFTNV